MEQFLKKRLRRNRSSESIRALLQETNLFSSDLIVPLFVKSSSSPFEPISSMPGVFRFSLSQVLIEAERLWNKGIKAVNLFGVIPNEKKNAFAKEAVNPGNIVFETVQALKNKLPSLCVMVDIALDPFTDHGHDGLVDSSGEVINDATLEILAEMSLLAAQAGADVVAPSDMMDGRVKKIRDKLDKEGFEKVGILAYTAKYASSFYGPFRDALQSAPKFGNKKSYQMNPGNIREALLEAQLDEEEGADMLLVKPALPYLDVLSKIKQNTNLPVGAYHVSGEYAMVMAAEKLGWLESLPVFLESLLSIKRAGADFILTYAAEAVADHLNS